MDSHINVLINKYFTFITDFIAKCEHRYKKRESCGQILQTFEEKRAWICKYKTRVLPQRVHDTREFDEENYFMVKLTVSIRCSYIPKDEVDTSVVFSSAFRGRVPGFYLEAIVAVGVGVGPVGALPDEAAGQVVEGHNGDGDYRYYTEEDDDGEYPVWVDLCFGFREFFLIKKTKTFTLISN